MLNNTRLLYTAMLAHIAQLNGVSDATAKFTVDPSVQQTLETRIQESSDFLRQINIVGVTEQQGEKLGLGVGGPIASTTNTAVQDRATKDPTDMDQQGYVCTKTDFDTHLTYGKLDAWAKFPDFQTRVRDAIIRRQALDRIMIGFNGTSRAATSDPGTNTMLQDVNIGWLQKYRANAVARVMDEGANAGELRVARERIAELERMQGVLVGALEAVMRYVAKAEDTAINGGEVAILLPVDKVRAALAQVQKPEGGE